MQMSACCVYAMLSRFRVLTPAIASIDLSDKVHTVCSTARR